MKTWKKYCAGVMTVAGLTTGVWAQPPTPPAAGAAAAAPAPAAAPAAAGGLMGFFGITPESKAACKEKLCAMPLVQAMINGLRPMAGMAGLGDPSCCPPPIGTPGAEPSKDQLAAPGAAGAAAKIQKDEAEAKERRAAVRYLGTVDCHWWPEAEKALIASLREDRNECVRYEAAIALGRGCCCTKATIEALRVSAEGSKKDGKLEENSERVKAAAFAALQTCLARVPLEEKSVEPPEPAPKPPEGPVAKNLSEPRRIDYYERVNQKSMAEVVQQAQKSVARRDMSGSRPITIQTGDRSLAGVFRHASGTRVVAQSETLSTSRPLYDNRKPAVSGNSQANPYQAANRGTNRTASRTRSGEGVVQASAPPSPAPLARQAVPAAATRQPMPASASKHSAAAPAARLQRQTPKAAPPKEESDTLMKALKRTFGSQP